jgi:amidase
MTKAAWELKAEKCQKITQNSLNPAWILPAEQLPPADQLDVSSWPKRCNLLTARELEITETTGTDLVSQMGAGKLTAVETVTAFLKRAHVAHQLVNFATEFMVAEALSRATELDAHFQKNGKLVGPLHGLPISVKEHIGFKGRICHASYVALTDRIAEEDAYILELLRNAGAVFHVRTNQPQSLMVSFFPNFRTPKLSSYSC